MQEAALPADLGFLDSKTTKKRITRRPQSGDAAACDPINTAACLNLADLLISDTKKNSCEAFPTARHCVRQSGCGFVSRAVDQTPKRE